MKVYPESELESENNSDASPPPASAPPAKNFFCSLHLSLLHPWHLSPICLLHLAPPRKCALARSANALINISFPFKLSALLTPSPPSFCASWITSWSSSKRVSIWSEVKAMGIRIRLVWPRFTRDWTVSEVWAPSQAEGPTWDCQQRR